ncbi:succinate--CoA ligase [GDP-forming] subunit beta, mitochondrial [Alligator sinensis]|uniref:Succinate--CoA ligase [GDP-forming] subunit beta, mitochondrial n=1 Tax=Alligator sinensis TaxID=38654 RepID=A0A3Q0GYT2_ALLSI|nr:succinate--CoA ligase [GDP-forming] subunit beta, mitochondrial [Alligator sinensis]
MGFGFRSQSPVYNVISYEKIVSELQRCDVSRGFREPIVSQVPRTAVNWDAMCPQELGSTISIHPGGCYSELLVFCTAARQHLDAISDLPRDRSRSCYSAALRALSHKAVQLTPRRWLNLQEYQSKKLMADHGVTVQRFFVADTANDALEAAKRLKAREIVLKAQILAGGRGKGVFNSGLKGGVHLTKDPAEVGQLAKQMIGYNLATKQTPKDGVKVKKVMVAEALDISRETYFAILMDRASSGPVMVGSPQGGVDIEEVAATTPHLIFKEEIDIFEGVKESQALCMAENLGFKGPLQQQAADQIKKLYNLFLKIDATQVEVNPFGETPEGQVVCFDAKINFDDNAEFRQKEIFAMDDKSENEPIENEAAKYDLKYIGLDGNIACFVNGAGLAMATCDIISLNGGKPANFLDLGGGVKEAQVYQAFKLLSADPKVEAILVNIFGGIVNCAIIANGITKACRELELKVPLVVRLEGTNVHEAQRILKESGLPITSASDLEDAAKKAVACVAKK